MQALVHPIHLGQNKSALIKNPHCYLLAGALAEGEHMRFPAASDDASAMRRCRVNGARGLDVMIGARWPGFEDSGRPNNPGC